ncbi:hypothetical protein ABZ611_08885 [Streptomyces sp. NPDC007861]|uniref:hypothetical protein n=1 Tax=Streptomyces sp. NPDC007861 TaxID=3154893 RepID=UPI0033C320F1
MTTNTSRTPGPRPNLPARIPGEALSASTLEIAAHGTAPYRVGDRITGLSYVPPEGRPSSRPAPVTGTVVQVGSGWAGIDADRAYVWVRLADGTECQALISEIEPLTDR